MNTAVRFLKAFDLALGRLLALILGGLGGFLVYLSVNLWGDTATLIMCGIGVGLLLIAGIMLYRRVTLIGVIDTFTISSWWN